MPLSHLLLCLSIATTLLPVTAPWPWLATLIMAVTAGLVNGQLTVAALAPIGAMTALAWMTMDAAGRPRREIAFLLLMLVLGLALSLHLLPGFVNPSYLVSASDDRPATLKYLNFDKGAAGMLMLAVLAVRQRRIRLGSATAMSRLAAQSGTPGWALPAVVAATLASSWLIAVAAGVGQPTLRWPDNAGLFLCANLFLTCVAEEAAFRGVVQGLLARRFGTDLRSARGWLPVVVAAVLFGAAHAAGGAAYVGLATLAGLGYGLVYALTHRIEAAILLHFALNALVFTTLNLRVG